MAKGKKTGGRRPGSKYKATLAREKALADLVLDAKDPLTFFAGIMRDPDAPFAIREAAADRLLPYFHPKLASVESHSRGQSHEDRLQQLQKMMEEGD